MDLSWSELLVVGVVALIIIGPKDLPGMFRELGRFMAKIRSMGREFSRAMEQAAKESGVKDVADDLKKVANPKSMGLDAVKSAADKFEKWDPLKNAAKPSKALTPAPMPASPTALPAAPATLADAAVEAVVPEVGQTLGPNTAALYERQTARKAVLDEAATKLRALSTAEVPPAPVAEKKPGRVRRKAEKPGGDAA